MENDNVIILSVNGKEKKYSIILSFDSDEKHYIVYTDGEKDKDGFIKTYAGVYEQNEDCAKLLPVEDDDKLALIEELLEKVDGENNN